MDHERPFPDCRAARSFPATALGGYIADRQKADDRCEALLARSHEELVDAARVGRGTSMNDTSSRFDVIVAGSGAAALTAAVTAAASGLRVLVLEKSEYIGGTSAISGGAIWVPCNPLMKASGIADDRGKATDYLSQVVGDRLRPEMARAFLEKGPEMVEFLQKSTELQFQISNWITDYYSNAKGAVQSGRSLGASSYDARRLGQSRALLRPPLPQLTLVGGMMFDTVDYKHFMSATQSLKSLAHVIRRLMGHAIDLARYGRGTRVTLGNALVARLVRSAMDHGVTIWTRAGLEDLVLADGRVVGVVIGESGCRREVAASRGVVLATGGGSHAASFRQEFLGPRTHHTLTVSSSQWDGVRIGLKAGGYYGEELYQNFLGYPMSCLQDRAHGPQPALHPTAQRAKPGIICVDDTGRRFVNEAEPYNDFTRHMNLAGVKRAFFICDERHLRSYGLGHVRPGPWWFRPVADYLKQGYLYRAQTVRALAQQLGIDPARLERTVAEANEYAATGSDPEFRKGETNHDRFGGDARFKPNPNLGSLAQAPFYAVEIFEGDLGTYVGLKIDQHARVLDQLGHPIPGLYACGLDAHSVFSGQYPSGGCNLAAGMVFGYIAARYIGHATIVGA
jgi:succinate dehydrogenase/fumarate reductase flavoprotein subunit